MNENLSTFTTKLRKSGSSLELTVPMNVCEFEGLEEGNYVKVMIKKLEKKEE